MDDYSDGDDMNLDRLKQAEERFLNTYPNGFEHPDMMAIAKKHMLEKRVAQVQEAFAEDQFSNTHEVVQTMSNMVSRSTMVSLFEKPKFRDYVNSLHNQHETILANGLKEMLHGDQEQGFNMMLDVLVEGKLAKWPLMTVLPVYFSPHKEVFVKPTTTKGVIQMFELESLSYKPRPSWEFYKEYRAIIQEMKANVDKRLSPNNAAFTGFRWMSMES